MKNLVLIFLLGFTFHSYAATSPKKEVPRDKVYTVEKKSPEILIGSNGEEIERRRMAERPPELWHLSLIRSSLTYNLPSLSGGIPGFSPILIGANIGKKFENHFYLYKGYYEISGEWERFERVSNFGNGASYSQKIDLYQLNIFQNFNVAWLLKHSLFFSVGVGFSPVFLASQQSVFGNSQAELGYMGMAKANIVYPLKKTFEIDLALKGGWGKVGDYELFISSASLGLNFE